MGDWRAEGSVSGGIKSGHRFSHKASTRSQYVLATELSSGKRCESDCEDRNCDLHCWSERRSKSGELRGPDTSPITGLEHRESGCAPESNQRSLK